MGQRLCRLGISIAALCICAGQVAAAQAAEGDPILDQCFTSGAVAPCSQISPAFNGVDAQLSPDGKHLYMLGRGTPLIRLFDRGANNALTPRAGAEGCYNSTGAGGCTAVSGLTSGDLYDIELSPDGTSVYVAGLGSMAHLQRDPATGVLTPMNCYGTGPGCTPIAPVSSVLTVEVSKDGQSVYTRGGNTFGVFQRNSANGTLIPEPDGEDCFSEQPVAGCSDTYGLAGNAFEMSFSPDGKFLYYPIQSPGGVGFFQRSANGTLTQISGPQGGCITTNGSSSAPGECATIPDGSGPAMSNAWAVTLSPSGGHVFVSGSGGTVVFSRNAEDGKLSKVECIAPSVITACNQRKGSAGMGVYLSPDGSRAIVGSYDVAGFGVYNFNSATGALTQLPGTLGCFSGTSVAGCSQMPGGAEYVKTAWTPDGLNFYVAGGSMVNMAQDYAPRCQSGSVGVTKDLSTAVGLLCTDPNGDPITLRISRGPTAGTLAEIDQAARTVRYNPFSGFIGSDSFGYQGVARGLASAEATMTLNVQQPPAPLPTGKARISNRISAQWKPFKTHTIVKSLSVADASTEMTLRVSCKGRGCPFKVRSLRVKKAGTQNLTPLFNFTKKVNGKKRKVISKLAVGAVVEVQVNAADRIGEVARYTMRKNKPPSSATLCTAPGSIQPKATC